MHSCNDIVVVSIRTYGMPIRKKYNFYVGSKKIYITRVTSILVGALKFQTKNIFRKNRKSLDII